MEDTAECIFDSFDKTSPPIFLNETNPMNITLMKYSPKEPFKLTAKNKILLVCPGGMNFGTSKEITTEATTKRSTRAKTTSAANNDTAGDGGPTQPGVTDASAGDPPAGGAEPPAEAPAEPPADAGRKRRAASEPEESASPPPDTPDGGAGGSDANEEGAQKNNTEGGNQTSGAGGVTSKSVTLTCVMGALQAETMEDNATYPDVTDFKCETRARFDIFMKVGFGSCSHNYYSIGIKVLDKIYEFIQICFDLRAMKPVFVRFIGRKKVSTLSSYITDRALDRKEKWWETDDRYKTVVDRKSEKMHKAEYIDLELPNYNFFISSSKYPELIKEKFVKHHEIVFYYETNLYPQEHYGIEFMGIIPDKFKLQTTIGWEALIFGNWKIFLDELSNRTQVASYEVYIGTSHIAQAPKDINCLDFADFVLRDHGRELAIPQYFWAYVYNNKEKVVVVSVNTPYYPVWDYSNPLPCENVCEQFMWLKKLTRFSQVSTFGLTYCCTPNSVAQFLHGFPKLY